MLPGEIAKYMILAGILLVVAGAGLAVLARISGPGPLPGDIVIKRENVTLYFPLATCLVLSLILTVLSGFLRK